MLGLGLGQGGREAVLQNWDTRVSNVLKLKAVIYYA